MVLLDKIKADSLAARKARNSEPAALLTTLLGEIETLAKAGRGEITDAVIVTVVKKFIKNNLEAQHHLEAASPAAIKLRLEQQLLETYLPKQLTEAELQVLIDDMLNSGVKDVGDCMKLLKTNHAGTYDGGMASKLLKARFALMQA